MSKSNFSEDFKRDAVGQITERGYSVAVGAIPEELDLTFSDLSPGMAQEAMARGQNLPFTKVRGQQADAVTLPFEDGSFDSVVAMHMLYHLTDPAGAIAEMFRVLKA